ncbi:hypothetical protein HDU83_004001 [Entophlyctis luteolus]|nr:hypothetical protein HDU83_004001 [Entophlyctis luteolus]
MKAITYLLHVLAAVALASPSPPQENILPDMTSDDLAVVHLRAVDFDSDGAIRTGGDCYHDGKYLKQYEEEEFEIAPVAKFVESYYGTLSAVASPSKIEKAVAHLQKLLAKRNDASTTNPNGVNVVLKGSTFDKAIEDAVVPYFVKFYAPWCTHCKHLAPIWEDLASQLRGKANIGEIDCTVDGSICTRENVRGYPSLRFMFPNLGSIEYSGRRALEDLKSYVQSVVEGSAVIVTSGKEITELAKRKEVAMVYVYDAEAVSDASLLNFLEVARSVKPLVSIYATPDHIAAAKSFGIDFDKLPALICVKDGGMEKRLYNPPLAPLDNKSQKVGLRTWILDNRHALVPQLTDANSREIMGNQRDSSEKLVVLGILDPVAQNGRQAIDSLRAAAKEWGKVGNSDKTVIFTWINGASKADYVKRVFGVNAESDMPTVVIVDPKEDQVYWKDEKGEALSLRRKDQLVNSVSLILAGNLRGQHISGWSGAITKAVERTVVPIVEFAVMHPIVFVVSLAVAVGVLLWVCMWAIDAGDAAAASEAAHRRNGSDLKRD